MSMISTYCTYLTAVPHKRTGESLQTAVVFLNPADLPQLFILPGSLNCLCQSPCVLNYYTYNNYGINNLFVSASRHLTFS